MIRKMLKAPRHPSVRETADAQFTCNFEVNPQPPDKRPRTVWCSPCGASGAAEHTPPKVIFYCCHDSVDGTRFHDCLMSTSAA